MNNRPQDISIEEFDYPLPDERIAKHPLQQRDACKLLMRSADGALSEHVFSELPELLPASAMLVYNNTRVINARLRFRKASQNAEVTPSVQKAGALIEIFCLEPVQPADYAQSFAATDHCSWTCFVGNSKRWKSGALTMTVEIPRDSQDFSSGASLPKPNRAQQSSQSQAGKPALQREEQSQAGIVTLVAERVSKEGNASIVEFSWDNPEVTFSQIISAVGEIPIPPYLNRSTEASDAADYQTVYSRIEGSVAAPTAGLHFTDAVLANLDRKGVRRRELTLHVGAGTFQPVKSETIGEHPMHSEFIAVPVALLRELRQALEVGNPVIAVGTTSVRTLESLYHAGVLILRGEWDGEVPQWAPYTSAGMEGLKVMWPTAAEAIEAVAQYAEARHMDAFLASTRIIIAPGYQYRIVKGMVTNFHQPKSTLLLLVSAFTGGDWQSLYRYALAHDFRFLSYGDACLLL